MYKFVLYEQGKFEAASSYIFVLCSDKCPPPAFFCVGPKCLFNPPQCKRLFRNDSALKEEVEEGEEGGGEEEEGKKEK